MWSPNVTKSNLLHIPKEMKGVGGWEGTHFLISNLLKGYNLKSKTCVLELFLHSIITLLLDNHFVEIHSRKFLSLMYINKNPMHRRPYPQTSSNLSGLRCKCCCCTTIWFGTFGFIIFNNSLDGILSKHAAVQLYWWERDILQFPWGHPKKHNLVKHKTLYKPSVIFGLK